MPYLVKDLPLLPAERALKTIAGRWKAIVLFHLFDGPKRLADLRRLAPSVSQKVLVQQLREMDEHGLVRRSAVAGAAPRVTYDVTERGRALEPILASLCEWGRSHTSDPDVDRACAAVSLGAAPVSRRAATSRSRKEPAVSDVPHLRRRAFTRE